jgi:hypothetical protein
MVIANERIRRNPLRYYLWVRLYNVPAQWLDVTDLTELKGDVFQGMARVKWNVFRFLPLVYGQRWCVWVAHVAYFGLKVVILLFFLADCLWLALRGRRCEEKGVFGLLLMGLVFVAARTVFFAFYISFIESRYMVTAWPFVLLMACHGFSQAAAWYGQGRERASAAPA